ncbi:hypothetical protein [Elioraea sp.]|uniref:hypothetical protein n=1 Tax=Elioraea sp. TaxID=2185103 RepID=UPI0025BA3DB4|nr:hypothetical protein [Elioraea sp.]
MNVTPSARIDARLDPAPPDTIMMQGAAPTVSWGAILVGAIVAIAFGSMLHALGAAIGASSVDAVDRDSPSGSTFTIAAASWMALSSALGLLLGGIVAARLAATWSRKDALLHGMGVWAVSFVIAIALVGTALSGGTVAAIRGITGAATSVAAAGGAAVVSQVDPSEIAAGLQRRLAAPSDPASASREDLMAEMADLAGRRLADGSWNPDDRARMEQLIAATAGIAPEEARQRLDQAEQAIVARARAVEEQARRAADVAATSGAVLAFWAFATMLLGLGAAVGGAAVGARR